MTIQEINASAKKNIGPHCKVCKECNGIVCKGVIPGPGGKGTGSGFIRNYQALREVALEMDTLHDVCMPDITFEAFGKTFSLPVFAAPVGAVQQHYSDLYDDMTYSETLVKGCKAAGSLAFTGDGVKSEVYNGTIEAIKRYDGHGVPTIKPWRKDEVIEKIKFAETANVVALAMDVDAAGLTMLAALGKPVFPISTQTLKDVIGSTDKPFVIKGIMTASGALKALEAGAYGIIVSNHGGRVLDETPATLTVLPEIARAVKGKMKIFIDGGFRSGLDVFKAIALGADAVLIARPFVTAVYGGGSEGVTVYIKQIADELTNAMLMTGCQTLADIDETKVRRL